MTSSFPKMPHVSVIVPTLRGEVYRVLESLARQTLDRTMFEVVVVADGCSDDEQASLEAVVKDFAGTLKVTVIRHEHTRGPAAARNSGAARALGELFFFTDDDCEVPALWLETHIRMHLMHPELGSVGGWYHFPQSLMRTNPYAQFIYLYYLVAFHPIDLSTYQGSSNQSYPQLPANNTANLSVRRVAFEDVGGFDEDFLTPGGEDAYFAVRMHRHGWRSLFIPYPVMHHRPLGLKKFLRLISNRGMGFYTFLQKEEPRNRRVLAHIYKQRWRAYVRVLKEHAQKHVSVASHRLVLLALGTVYILCVESPVACMMHGLRWKWYK